MKSCSFISWDIKKENNNSHAHKDLPEGTLQAILKQTGFMKKDLEK